MKYDKAAKKQGKEYRFIFVCSDGSQLQKITGIVEEKRIMQKTDPHVFAIEQANDALRLVFQGHTEGKVLLRF